MKKKKINFVDLIFMNISALYGIRWIARSTASSFGLGLAAIPSWFVFAILFFIPQALICAELASTYSSDGGLYTWVKEAMGEKWGFMAGWLNWTSKLFWYASFMTYFTINIAYFLGKPDLVDKQNIVLIMSVAVFWILSIMSTKGMGQAKIFTNLGALGSTIPTVILISLCFLAVVFLKKTPSASVYTVSSMMPKMKADSFVAISSIIFGFTGGEVLANFVTEMKNPKKDYPRTIFISAILVAGLYVIGSIAITLVLPTDQIQGSTGILDALSAAAGALGIGSWIVKVVAAGVAFSMLGATIIYIASPIKMLFGSVPKGMFGEGLTKKNGVGIPEKAVYLQASIVTVLFIATSVLPGIDAIYNVLVTMTALTALFPYVLLFVSYIRLRKRENKPVRVYELSKNNKFCIIIGYEALALCIVGIIFACAPVMGTLKDNIIYEIEMIGGGIVVILLGLMLWNRYAKRQKS